MIDLRTDTVTQPSPVMRRAMAEAEVGNESYGEDPTILRLERRACELTGQEAALFVASGKQGNLAAVLTHCDRGDGVIMGRRSHMYHFESRGVVTLSGVQALPVDDSEGIPTPETVASASAVEAYKHTSVKLLCLENTHNWVGGAAIPPDLFARTVEAGRAGGLKIHLDGARIFDAAARWNVDASVYAGIVDSVQFCFTKSLGAPLGSMLCGSRDFIKGARVWRNRLGGSFRQVGIVGAAGLIALDEMRLRLHEDHTKAARLAQRLKAGGVPVESNPWSTNMVFVDLGPDVDTLETARRCKERGVLVGSMGPGRLRLVCHVDISEQDIDRAAKELLDCLEQ